MAQLINEAKRFQQLAGIKEISDPKFDDIALAYSNTSPNTPPGSTPGSAPSKMNEVELKITDLGPEFEKVAKEIFGDTVVVKDIDVAYRPSTDTGNKPHLYMGVTIPSVGDKDNYKGALLNIGFYNKEGKGVVKYDNYSKDKEATAKEFEEKLIPAFKKAAAIALGKVVKDPNQLTQSTVGSGYKYEEKDQADLDKYVAELPNLSLQESIDIDSVVNEALETFRKENK